MVLWKSENTDPLYTESPTRELNFSKESDQFQKQFGVAEEK